MARERSHNDSSVTAELRTLHSPDLSDLRKGPNISDNFCILIQALIGPHGGSGEESFGFTVCTPKWLSENLGENEFLFARHYLLVSAYDYDLIFRVINSLCKSVSGLSWREVALKLSRYGSWEFEDYRSE